MVGWIKLNTCVAIQVIPRQLCDNAGFDATDVLNKLRQKHALASGTYLEWKHYMFVCPDLREVFLFIEPCDLRSLLISLDMMYYAGIILSVASHCKL